MSPTSPTFAGIIPPVITPWTSTGQVDLAGLERLIDHLLAAGVDGIFALGSTGEVAYLTTSQRLEVARTIVARVAGRVPVIAGAIELTAPRCVELARELAAAGADAVVITSPVYAIHDVAETADHFRLVANAIDVPLFAYDVPVRSGAKLNTQMLVELGREGTLAGVKDSTGDDVSFRRLLAANKAAGEPLRVFTGHEVVVDAMALIGAHGAVPGLANVEAAGYVRLWQAAQAGDWDTARSEQERLNALFEIVFQAPGRSADAAGVGAFKCAMAHRGLIDSATMATPVQALTGEPARAICAIVDSVYPPAP